jgi:hypothetical protein
MISASKSESVRPISWIRRVITYAVLLLIGLMLGFVPMWAKTRESANSLSQATSRADLVRAQNTLALEVAAHQLDLARIQNSLASAAIDARRGDYEAARQAASSFYTSLRAETDKGAGSILSQTQREGAQPLFTRQDDIITLLSRNDPAAADQLSDLYVSYRETMNK